MKQYVKVPFRVISEYECKFYIVLDRTFSIGKTDEILIINLQTWASLGVPNYALKLGYLKTLIFPFV